MTLEIALNTLVDEITTVVADTNDLNTVRNVLVLLLERVLHDVGGQVRQQEALQGKIDYLKRSEASLNAFGAKTLAERSELQKALSDIIAAWGSAEPGIRLPLAVQTARNLLDPDVVDLGDEAERAQAKRERELEYSPGCEIDPAAERKAFQEETGMPPEAWLEQWNHGGFAKNSQGYHRYYRAMLLVG